MKTPLYEAAEGYILKDTSRMHMPGHKGRIDGAFASAAPFDLTEIPGMDSLYECSGAIRRTERMYSGIYGSGDSLLSAGGASLCIQTMLALYRGRKLAAGRMIHSSAVAAMALLDIDPVWIYPEAEDEKAPVPPPVTPADAKKALEKGAEAVYVTSPDYFGNICDISGISKVCREYGASLLVDNAHGAHLKFLEEDIHPMTLGADACADSLHKTLPVLTGGALLHLKDPSLYSEAKEKMRLFGSTSPSYLIMLSADMLLEKLDGEIRTGLRRLCGMTGAVREKAGALGMISYGNDPARLTLSACALGYDGKAFAGYLREHGIEPEYAGGDVVILMPSVCSGEEDFNRLERVLESIPAGRPVPAGTGSLLQPAEKACTIRNAVFAPYETVPAGRAAGRISAELYSPCPPGIPIIIPGEKITESIAEKLEKERPDGIKVCRRS